MKNLTRYHLKIIAITSMLFDHTWKLFIGPISTFFANHFDYPISFILFQSIESLGRIAFVLFAFMISEGCKYTHNINKYIMRLLIFGFISEIPFQYFISIIHHQSFQFSFGLTNVFFTLTLGAIAIKGNQALSKKSLLSFLPLCLCCIIAYFINCDYDVFGVLLIFSFYYFLNKSSQLIFAILLLFSYYIIYQLSIYPININLVITSTLYFIGALLGIYCIAHDHSQLGKPLKYIFYIFYPVHLIILCAIYQLFYI